MLPYPWQTKQWEQLNHALQQQRLPHALLFTGIAGVGKKDFAEAFSQALLCSQPTGIGYACGKCHACRLVEGRVHPDVRWIEPEKAGHAIKVDQIRELAEFAHQSALKGSRRIVIIHPANNLNTSASNALLKTLEEPAGDAVLILVSDQRDKLLPTILSRCQTISFSAPERLLAMTWLNTKLKDNAPDPALLLTLSHGAPLAALQMVKEGLLEIRAEVYQALSDINKNKADPVKVAAAWKDIEPLTVVDLMLSWLADLSRLQSNITDISNNDFSAPLLTFKQIIPVDQVLGLISYLLQVRRELSNGINLNKQLVAESILIRWAQLC